MSRTVWAVVGIYDGEPFEDPGAEEVISLHETAEGAHEEKRLRDEIVSNHERVYILPDGYDYVEIRAFEVKEP